MNTTTEFLDAAARAREGSAVLDPSGFPEPSPHPAGANLGTPAAGPLIRRLLLIVVVLIAAAFAAGLVPRLRERALVKADTRELAVPTVSVTSAAPSANVAPLTLSGELKPLAEASIYARANGYVRRWLVDLGAHVEAGQLLAELDTPEIDRELLQARAQLVQAEAARDLARTTGKRWKEMLVAKTVSPQEADEKASDLDLKKATVEAARANVQRLEDVAGFSRITAPFAGTITARGLDVGQLVNAGAGQELFRLGQLEKLRVFVRVPQTHARSVAAGQKAEMTMSEIPGRKFEATVVRTAGAVDAASRTLLTELEVDNSKAEILAGSYAQVRLPDAKPEPVVTLPSNTLLFRPEGPQIAVVVDQHAAMRGVTLGRDFGNVIEVLSGVGPQDRVILNPADSLVDGAEVRVIEAPAANR
ncbi:MAG TPA: efflux RND transporter periplasmic adaptor subunit [Chthoniobacteraceae bacterium]|nr:efflux RND transporter periplasmic adaptor subunit [Chthoniobacteraceae bacterium]